MEWIKKPLGEIIQFKNGKKRPADEGAIPVYGGNGILGYATDSNYEQCVIIGRVGAYCGSVYYEENACWVSDNAIAALPKSGTDIVYAYYLLKGLNLNKRHIGTSQPLLTQEILNRIKCRIPSLAEQRQIGSVLRALDQKIALNNKINDNLYEILQSVFQSRFGLSEESARVGTLSGICAYSKDRVAVSKLGVKNYYSTENMLPSKAGSVDAASLPTTQQTTKCNIGDVLVSNIRPYFKKIVYCQSEGGCSTDVLCFTPRLPSLSSYLFCTLYADSFFNYMVAGSKGTKMPRGDKLQIMTYPVVIPTEDELRAFDEVAQPILRQIHINSDENTYLAALRDTLLPKLMSGELDVSGIQL